MTTLRQHLMIGLTVCSLGVASFATHAQEAPAGAAPGHARFAERLATHQAKLHDKLKLTAEQEPAWNTYVAAIAPPAGAAPIDRAAFAQLSAPEKMEKWLTLSKEHIVLQENHLAALKTFYAVLTPEQKSVFDHHASAGWHGMRGREHGPAMH